MSPIQRAALLVIGGAASLGAAMGGAVGAVGGLVFGTLLIVILARSRPSHGPHN